MEKKKFFAKSFPEETIQEHTDILIDEYERLKRIYPNCRVNWDLLKIACLYHDIGKINNGFQDKIKHRQMSNKDIPHGVVSTLFLDSKELLKTFEKDDLKLLFSSIYFHHDRDILDSEEFRSTLVERLKKEIESLNKIVEEFEYEKIKIPTKLRFRENYISRFLESNERDLLSNFVLLKGFLNKIDYAASAHIPVEYKNDFLESCLDSFMKKLISKAEKEGREKPSWNELQHYMKNHQDENIIAIAQTGMGKSEAGLWWVGNNKGFFTLPIRTAINAIYMRIKEDILNDELIDKRLGLLHSETKGRYLELKENEKDNNVELIDEKSDVIAWNDYYISTRQLSLPITVCTLDQLFTVVFRYKGYEPKLATLSYSKIIIDEIQMYTPEIIGFLICGLSMVQELGGKFAILTATFPGYLKELMLSSGLKFKMPPKPFVDDKKIRHSIKWNREKLNSKFILEKYKKNKKVLVICNTVKKCQAIYEEIIKEMEVDDDILKKQSIIDREINLFHAKFIYSDRAKKEKAILEFGKLYDKNGNLNDRGGIWIANSIAEASLDIDFDILITELSDVNGLFQRLGRCYRKRIWEKDGFNCYVFDGGDELCSGVGYNIDKEIFELSKKYLRSYFEENPSKVSEQQKMDLVEKIYSTENMKNLQYYKTVLECIKQPNLYLAGEKSATDAQKLFRNINSEQIIPSPIYKENEEEILLLENKINSREFTQEEKTRAREKIKQFTLSIESYRLIKAKKNRTIQLGKYDEIYVVESYYDSSLGLKKIIQYDGEEISNIL